MGIRVLVFGVALLFTSTEAAKAAPIVFSNLGPGDSFQADVGWSVGMPPGNPNWEVAASFTPDVTARLSGIEVPFADVHPFFGLPPSTLALSLRADDGSGKPSSIALESFLYDGPFGSLGAAILIPIQSILRPKLLAGVQYWLVAANANGAAGATLGWSFNSIGDDASTFGTTLQGSGGVFSELREPDVAFRITGTTVPEPTALLLIAASAVGWCCRKRRHGPRRA
jgi:hypothetical protein